MSDLDLSKEVAEKIIGPNCKVAGSENTMLIYWLFFDNFNMIFNCLDYVTSNVTVKPKPHKKLK
jgi:hypothetical protein